MNQQIQLFLSTDDEVALSSALLAVRPRTVFVDGNRWDTPVPVLASSIATCSSWRTFLWDQSIVASLAFYARNDGQFEGPMTACVVEITRSTMQGNLMLSGRIAQSLGGPDAQLVADMHKFVADIWKALKKMTSHPIVGVNPETGEVTRERVTDYRAGDHAIAWASSAPGHFMRARSTQHFYKPKIPV